MPSKTIECFRGDFSFLSNFAPAPVVMADGLVYPTAEHAFQAQKTEHLESRKLIRLAPTPGKAKRLGRQLVLRSDWEQVKIAVMKDVIQRKFDWGVNPDLVVKLLQTAGYTLEEGNDWGDRFWGKCGGQGLNWLGRILMGRRAELLKQASAITENYERKQQQQRERRIIA